MTAADGPHVTVDEDTLVPFHLVDDDAAAHPFDGISRDLLQEGAPDSAGANLLAQAYIHPRYDLQGPKHADFRRNVLAPITGRDVNGNDIRDEADLKIRLAEGRDSPLSQEGFWVSYVQGAFQEHTDEDGDPNAETLSNIGGTCGATAKLTPLRQ